PFPAHPEYPSGHALFTGAAETVLRDFFGTDQMTVSVANPIENLTRTFTSFSQMAKSVEDARVWAGIHFRSADIDGTQMGRRVADYALKNCLRPIAQGGACKEPSSPLADSRRERTQARIPGAETAVPTRRARLVCPRPVGAKLLHRLLDERRVEDALDRHVLVLQKLLLLEEG